MCMSLFLNLQKVQHVQKDHGDQQVPQGPEFQIFRPYQMVQRDQQGPKKQHHRSVMGYWQTYGPALWV